MIDGAKIASLCGAAAMTCFWTVPTLAQETIRGQGGTLPASLYENWLNPGPNENFEYSYNAPLRRPSGSFIAVNTGSVAGKAAFQSHLFNNNTWFPNGLGEPGQPLPSEVTKAQKEDIQFVGSDAILTIYDLIDFSRVRWGDPIQVPSVSAPVTIAFNKNGLNLRRQGPTGEVAADGTQAVGNVLYLSRQSYCGIFTGGIANWNDPRIVADNGGVAPSNEPITVVVRYDGSGTTEIFSRHLDTVCDGSTEAGGFVFPATNPSDTQTPTGLPTVAWNNLIPPTRLVYGLGDGTIYNSTDYSNGSFIYHGGVSKAIASIPNSIGYLSPSYTDLVATPAPHSGSPAPSTANLQNQADINRGRNNNFKHSATWANALFAQNGIEIPTASDRELLWGTKLAILNPMGNNPTAANAYPIVGFTFLNFYTCYPEGKRGGIRSFISYYTKINANGDSAADIVAKAHGFAPLSSALKQAVRDRALTTGTSPRGISKGPISGYCTL